MAPVRLLVLDECDGVVRDSVLRWEDVSIHGYNPALKVGTHTIRFVLTSKIWSRYDVAQQTVSWNAANSQTELSYVWAVSKTVQVQPDMPSQSIDLPLVVGQVMVHSTDSKPGNCASVTLKVSAACQTLDLSTMQGVSPAQRQVTVNAMAYTGVLSFFTFVPTCGNVGRGTITANSMSGAVIASHEIYDPASVAGVIPVSQGHVSLFEGAVFSAQSAAAFTFRPQSDWTKTDLFHF